MMLGIKVYKIGMHMKYLLIINEKEICSKIFKDFFVTPALHSLTLFGVLD